VNVCVSGCFMEEEVMTDYKNVRYKRPSPASELQGFGIALVLVLVTVMALGFVDQLLFAASF
jgi:hypothetical protein